MVWKRLGEKSVMVTYDPLMSHPMVENKDGKEVIRATFQAVYLVTQLDARTTKVELGLHVNFGGNLPRFIVNSFIIPSFNRIVSHTQAFFALSLSLNSLTKSDGKLLGEVFVNQIKAARKRGGWKKRADLSKLGVDEFLYISVAMRKLLPLYPWFRALLHEMSLNRAKASRTVTKSLPDVKEQDAINLAKGLLTIILTNTEAEAAVDHWIAQNVALEEFEKEHVWMRSFFVEIAQFSLNTSNLGLKLRVSSGAFLSMVDLATDIYMTIQFLNTAGQESYGRTSALLIGLTLAIQIFLAHAQNKKSSPHFFLDTFCILIGFKPALDAYRVGSGADKLDHQLMPPLMEMTFCKGIEVVFEAIPSSVVQIFALILAEERKLGALLSILVSAATIAFTSTMINYDWDTSPEKRGKDNSFYGFVPDKSLPRAICFMSMMALSFSHVLLLTFSCAILATMRTSWLLYFLGVDMGLFFLYKIARRDFFYWANFRGIVRLVGSLLLRFCTKILVNFTMLIQMRHPQEVGGLPFLISILYSVVGSFGSVHLYANHYDGGNSKIDENTLYLVVGSLFAMWFISILTFASVIKRKYLHTFYDTVTASTYNRDWYLRLREDQDKSHLLLKHPDIYSRWGDQHVMPWTLNNWERWEEEKPIWFTDSWIEHVPNEYIPYDWRVKYKKTKGRVDNPKKRRGSVGVTELLVGEEER